MEIQTHSQHQSQKSKNYNLSTQTKTFIKKELTRYEDKRSAVLPALYQVQKENGWISTDTVSSLSQFMGIPEAHINEVLHFYTCSIQSLLVNIIYKFVVT